MRSAPAIACACSAPMGSCGGLQSSPPRARRSARWWKHAGTRTTHSSCGGRRTTSRYGALALAPSTLCRLRWSTASAGARSATLLRALLGKATTQSGDISMPWPGLPARERVRAFLADFRSRTDQPMPMTRAQIGQYLGMAEETVVRALKALARADAA